MSTVLLVYPRGGPPLEYVLPRMAVHAEIHILALAALPKVNQDRWLPLVKSLTHVAPEGPGTVVDHIVDRARAVGADAVMTLSEFAVIAVAQACQVLGLPGAGEGATTARDKRAMRAVWQGAGVPVPGFTPVRSEGDLRAAFEKLQPPLLLKAAWSVGSIAQQVITSVDDVAKAWATSVGVIGDSAREGIAELHAPQAETSFLVEELVTGAASDWYGDTAMWGDYVSVEGIVAEGRYHPLCVIGKLPTIPLFTERASISPAVLPESAQRRIEELSRAAVDALGLSTCATHTEIKLGPGGQMWVIETAARFGGAMTTHQVETTFGLDMVGMLTRQLLGQPVDYPPRMLTEGQGASASLLIHPVHADGSPWETLPIWDFSAVPWPELLNPDSRITVVEELSRPDGSPMLPNDPAGGSKAMAALCLVTGKSASAVAEDCHRIVDALPYHLSATAYTAEETR